MCHNVIDIFECLGTGAVRAGRWLPDLSVVWGKKGAGNCQETHPAKSFVSVFTVVRRLLLEYVKVTRCGKCGALK
jgi:hypothetical protein